MAHFRQIRTATRAPRVALRGSVSVVMQLENLRQYNARLHQISVTGGLLELANYIDERSKVTLTFHVNAGVVHAKAEMFFPIRGGMGYMQPFRFVSFRAGALHTLESEIHELLAPGLPPSTPAAPTSSVAQDSPTKSGHGSGLRLPRFFHGSF